MGKPPHEFECVLARFRARFNDVGELPRDFECVLMWGVSTRF